QSRPSRLGERAGPVAAEELADGQEPARLGAGAQVLAASGVAQGGLETAVAQGLEPGAAMIPVGLERRAEQPQVALAASARVGPGLAGAAGGAPQFLVRARNRGGQGLGLQVEDQVLDLAQDGPDPVG